MQKLTTGKIRVKSSVFKCCMTLHAFILNLCLLVFSFAAHAGNSPIQPLSAPVPIAKGISDTMLPADQSYMSITIRKQDFLDILEQIVKHGELNDPEFLGKLLHTKYEVKYVVNPRDGKSPVTFFKFEPISKERKLDIELNVLSAETRYIIQDQPGIHHHLINDLVKIADLTFSVPTVTPSCLTRDDIESRFGKSIELSKSGLDLLTINYKYKSTQNLYGLLQSFGFSGYEGSDCIGHVNLYEYYPLPSDQENPQ